MKKRAASKPGFASALLSAFLILADNMQMNMRNRASKALTSGRSEKLVSERQEGLKQHHQPPQLLNKRKILKHTPWGLHTCKTKRESISKTPSNGKHICPSKSLLTSKLPRGSEALLQAHNFRKTPVSTELPVNQSLSSVLLLKGQDRRKFRNT